MERIPYIERRYRVPTNVVIPIYPYLVGAFCYSKAGIIKFANDIKRSNINEDFINLLDISMIDALKILTIASQIESEEE